MKKLTNQKPKLCREVLGLRPIDVASRSGLGLSTVLRCEKTGEWPRNASVRSTYLAYFGLEES